MGYVCPVCETPQRDGEHLADHLAFTAMLREDGHADWLDEVAPGWGDLGTEELAPRVVDRAEETDFESVFEDTSHGAGDDRPSDAPTADPLAGGDAVDGAAATALSEARELTRQMRGRGEASDEEEPAGGDGRSDEEEPAGGDGGSDS